MIVTRFFYIPVILLILFISHSVCFPTDVDMQIISGFDNYHKQDRWLPLRTTFMSSELDNNLSVSIQDSVYGDQQIYSTPISVFGDTKKIKYLYLRPERLAQNLDVRLKDNNGKVILEKESRLNVIPSESILVVIVNQNENGVKSLHVNIDSSRKVYVANVSAEYLPDRWKGYDSVDAIILGNFSVDSLSDSQKIALKDWLFSGGTLILSGGADAQSFIGTFIEALLPVKINGTRILQSITSLTQRFGYNFPNIPMVVASSKLIPEGKAIIAEDNGLPIIAERKIGTGKIIFLGFDYADPALKSWEGNSELWKTIIPEQQKQANVKYENLFRLLSAQRHLSLPSYKVIGGFLLIYVLCLGIVRYVFYERKKGLTWIIMVLTTTVFALGAMGFSYVTGQRLPIISDLSIVDIYQDTQRARIISYISPLSSKADLSIDFSGTDAIFIENPGSKGTESYWGNNFRLIQGDVPKIEIFGMKVLSSHFFYSESCTNFKENISVNAQSSESVRITNYIPFNLLDCYLFLNGRYAQIGALNAGDKRDIKLNQTFSGNVFDVYSVEDDGKSKFINTIKPILADNVLIGWMNGSALKTLARMNVKGGYKSSGMALVIIHI